jgi:hypothetical protein
MSILQVSLFFLTIERGLIINFPYSYSKFHQIKLLYLMIFSMVVISGINVGFHLADFYAFPKNDKIIKKLEPPPPPLTSAFGTRKNFSTKNNVKFVYPRRKNRFWLW